MSKLTNIIIALTGTMPTNGANLAGEEGKFFVLRNLEDGREIIFQPNASALGIVPSLSLSESDDGQVTLVVGASSWTFGYQEEVGNRDEMFAAAQDHAFAWCTPFVDSARHLVAAL